ncbi:bromodomain-containing protein 8-like isoform X2 [Perognathus longimembris pacificus]|uniref:bromodomain-containing protein 8-like isoform X2 n=1 Tax=Perognathus longimembris pacificus TaxID=214514 RepID=UPI002019CAAD|nr:bromodomain-containing protein 8-like isoform X2 [Perognathus longimembris pacificus]
MGREWVWLDSERDYPNESELSNDCRSLFSSWDSSLDLDVAYLMEPLCISSKEPMEDGCTTSGTRQKEGREIEATEEDGEPCRETEELLANIDLLTTEKKLLEEYRKPKMTPVLSNTGAIQELFTESGEEAHQDSKEEDQGEGYISDVEEQPPSGDIDDGFSVQETPLVNFLYNRTSSSKLTDLSQDDPVQNHLLFKKTLLPVWKMIASHRFSSPFLKPVSERQAPGYKDVVKRPMDLTTLKRNLSKGRIRTMAQFQRDLMLMFQNAVMYNDSDHHVYHMAVEMQREVLEQIQVLSIWLDKRRDLSSLE